MNDLSVTQDIDVTTSDVTVVTDFDVEVIQTQDAGPPGPRGPQGVQGVPGPDGPVGPPGNTIWYGTRDPLAGDGLPGDSWINTATSKLFGPKSNAGIWPPGVSLIGPQGPLGPQGVQGIQGPIGPQGNPGTNGVDGNTVLYGSVDPAAGTGVNGNFYINTTTHFIFGPKAVGVWPAGTSLIGPQGIQGPQGVQGAQGAQGVQGVPGNTVLYGAADPVAGTGIDGNFYINTTSHFMFGPKAGGAWPAGTSLIGPIGPQGIQGTQGIQGPQGNVGVQGPQGVQGNPGVDGNTVLYGAVAPAAGVGVNGNFYINTATNFIYGPKAGGAWPAGTSLVGPQGPQGIQGIAGAGSPATAVPLVDSGAGAVGVSVNFAREDHVHPFPPAVRFDAAQALTGPQILQARQNLSAAPFDAMAFGGMQINGSFDISQENGVNQVAVLNTSKYICDNFYVACANAAGGQLICRQYQSGGVLGFANSLQMLPSAGLAFAAADYSIAMYMIEGSRWARLGFGNGGALPVTLAFWVWCAATGTATASIRNAATNRAYLVNFNIPTANQWQYVTITIPGDMAGAWNVADTANAAYVGLCFGAGANNQDVPGGWIASSKFATAQTTNFFSAANGVILAGLGIFPGAQAPTAAQHPLIMRPAQSERALVQRYFQLLAWNAEGYGAPRVNWTTGIQPMRVAPTVTRNTVGTMNNIRSNDPSFVIVQAMAFSSVSISMEAAVSGFCGCSNFVEALNARF